MREQVEALLGTTLEAYCDHLIADRPSWVTEGSLSHEGTRFLFEAVLASGAETAVEIGTASGFSATVLCSALSVASRARLITPDFRVVSYDLSETYYADRTKRVGDAAREQLPADLRERVQFKNPARAADLTRDFGSGHIRFLFIDGDHWHPWPMLDLLAALDCLSEGAVVVFDDINLPLVRPDFPQWGAKYLFDSLVGEKRVSSGYSSPTGIPNMGSIRIPDDKESLRSSLVATIPRHQWETYVHRAYLARLGVQASGPTHILGWWLRRALVGMHP